MDKKRPCGCDEYQVCEKCSILGAWWSREELSQQNTERCCCDCDTKHLQMMAATIISSFDIGLGRLAAVQDSVDLAEMIIRETKRRRENETKKND